MAVRAGLCVVFATIVATSAHLVDYLPEHRSLVYAFIAKRRTVLPES